MLACVVKERGVAALEDIRVPDLGDRDVLIEVKAAGLCGTDRNIFKGDYYSAFPIVPGHEFSGVVVAVGAQVTQWHPGDRVSADPNIFCESCSYCKQNQQNFCSNFQAIGVTRNGAFAEYVVAPEANVFSIGDIPFEEAALIEPLACVVYGQERLRPPLGADVLIMGSGSIGLLHAQLASINGASSVTVVDINQDRLELAESYGFDTFLNDAGLEAELRSRVPEGFHVVIEATGSPAVVQDSLSFLRNSGSLLVFGVSSRDSEIRIRPYDIYKKDLTITGSFALKKTFRTAVKLIASGAIDVSALTSGRVSLADMPAVLAGNSPIPNAIKTIMTND